MTPPKKNKTRAAGRARRESSENEQPGLPSNIRLEAEPDRLQVDYFNKRWLLGLSSGLFGFLWTAVVVQIPADLIRRQAFNHEILLAIPFFLVSLFFLFLVMRCFLHRETLRIDENGLDWRLSFFIPIVRRKVSWDDLVAVNIGTKTGNERMLIRGWGLEIETKTKTFHTLLDLDDSNVAKNLQNILRRFIKAYRLEHELVEPISETEKNRRRGSLQLIETPDTLEIQGVSHVSWEERCFCIVWFVGWTFGVVALIYMSFFGEYEPAKQTALPYKLLVLAIFGSVWIFAGIAFFWRNFRWEYLRLDSDGLYYRQMFFVPFILQYVVSKEKRIPLSETGLAKKVFSQNGVDIEIPTSGLPLTCFHHLPGGGDPEAFLVPLNNRLEKLGVSDISRRRGPDADSTDDRWKYVETEDCQALTRHGWIPFLQLATLLFVCFFWNSIVGILFVSAVIGSWLQNQYWLCLGESLFFIPFILLGLFFFVGLLVTLLQYLCRYTISFEPDGVRYRRTWFGIGSNKLFRWDRIGKMSIVRRTLRGQWERTRESFRNPENTGSEKNPFPFAIEFFDTENIDGPPFGTIPDLLEGEARRIVTQIRQRQKIEPGA